MKRCYNCGKELKKNYTTEHIPAKNLYFGFSDSEKKQLITVPACNDCNHYYSKIDNEIRDLLAIKNNSFIEKQEFSKKGVKSILRRANWISRSQFNESSEVVSFSFNYSNLRELHIKNFKGLFYWEYGFPLQKDFFIDVITEGDEDKIGIAKYIYSYLMLDDKFDSSGDPKIFKYKIRKIPDDIYKNINMSNTNIELTGYFAILIYHNEICAIIICSNSDFIKSFQQNK